MIQKFLLVLVLLTNTYSFDIFISTNNIYINHIDIPDHTSLIQQSLDNVNNINVNEGAVINLEEGIYIISDNLIVKNNTYIKGSGMDKTILRLVDYAPAFKNKTRKTSGLISAKYINKLIVSDLTLDGNKKNQYNDKFNRYGKYGIYVESSNKIWFDKVKIINFQGYGFDPHGSKQKQIWSKDLLITNCIAENNSIDGFTIDQTQNAKLINNTSINNDRHGFNIVTLSSDILLQNNTAINNGYVDPDCSSGCGFMMQTSSGNIFLENNFALNNKKAGMCLNDVSNININNNTISDSCLCFDIAFTSDTNITNNYCATNKFINLKFTDDIDNNNNIFNKTSCNQDNQATQETQETQENKPTNNSFKTNYNILIYIMLFILLQ